VGGHSAESTEVIFGLSVVGICHPSRVVRNCTAQAEDKIILTKPLGFGLYAQAVTLGGDDAAAEVAWRLGRQLNTIGAVLGGAGLVNAMTDVTGFGLLGHLYEMAHGSKLRAHVNSSAVPSLPACRTYIERGLTTGAGLRNRSSVAKVTARSRRVPKWLQFLLTEPETNGGLLLSVNQLRVHTVMEMVRDAGFREAAVIGEFGIGPDGIEIT
jgi:selenide, water dikinase